MHTDKEKLEAIAGLATTDPVLFRRQVNDILNEDKLSFPQDREIRVSVETSDFATRTVQKFIMEKAWVTQTTVNQMPLVSIQGYISNVDKRRGDG